MKFSKSSNTYLLFPFILETKLGVICSSVSKMAVLLVLMERAASFHDL